MEAVRLSLRILGAFHGTGMLCRALSCVAVSHLAARLRVLACGCVQVLRDSLQRATVSLAANRHDTGLDGVGDFATIDLLVDLAQKHRWVGVLERGVGGGVGVWVTRWRAFS